MKKIISIIAVIAMLCTFSLTAFAAETTVTTADALTTAMAAGGTVKLDADLSIGFNALTVPENVTTVLDLNGHTLTSTAGVAGMIYGKLTITDSSDGKTGTLNSANTSRCTREFFSIYGELTINGGTFDGATQSYFLFSGNTGSKMTVNSGVFNVNCTTGAINSVFDYSSSIKTLVINGGTFNATGATQCSLYYAYNTSVTVNGGTFNGAIKDSNNNIVYTGNVKVDGNTTTVISSNKTMVALGSESYDVSAKYDGGVSTPDVYSVDVSWGAMEFTYTVGGSMDWNAADHSYKDNSTASWSANGNTVTVTNHSNKAVTASFGFAKDGAITDDITGSFDVTSEQLDAGTVGGYDSADKVTSTLTIEGILDSAKTDLTKVGAVTVTIQ